MKKALAALLLTCVATTAKAEIFTYDCTLHRMEHGWISERVILSVDPENKRARVYDGYIHNLEGAPKDARFKITRKGDYRVSWKMKIPASNGGLTYVSYTGDLNPEKQRLDLTARFPQENVLNRPTGYGGCSVQTGESLYGS